ncbi:2-polyprenyl-6-methoxyphenol hydroxylase-like FAD-dependent oxidoreductase [Ancylobacter sp. 3268]|uniref:FAD binding domain-containing protein n=1 Tax=Ancylobacter sp. 3268 TaxID=2817752 RepID=UPI0028670594|nr:FAD binding domain-containing protein [Ancylobacter sp. 3268]MDR6952070.1 2-polyprenyl-6-methoxyphenol hydroxylase-like FAD-dependent oxidoreductase [Ancylobacter sp. 3268]
MRIVIAGGSVGGLFAAELLRRAGHDVTIYERSSSGLEGRGAGLVAQQEVFAMLREAGVEHVARFGVEARERIVLDRAGAIVHRQATPQTQLSWDRLFRVFRERVPEGSYVGGRAVTGVTQEAGRALVHLADGTTQAADLVIAADGLGSTLRAAVAGPGARPAYAGYVAWRGLVPETAVPAEAAAVLFERFAFYDMPGAQALGYLVPGPDGAIAPGRRRYNWVWYRRSTPEQLAEVLTDADGQPHDFSLAPGQMRPEAAEALRADALRLLPPAFAAAVEAEPRPFVQAIFDYAAPRLVAGRLVLIGDAAFVARPHTAMGVAKAAGDAFALRDALAGARELPAALAAFERARLEHGRAVVAYGRRLGASLG